MTKSQEFIKKYARALETGADFYNFDSCIPKPELAEGKRKFLLILPTPAITKSVSATVSVIVDMFAEEMPGWYIDVAYLPTAKDLQVYDKCNMPYCIGQQLHLDASHYDMVGFSISVLHEVLTTPVIMKSFSRCDKPIPLSWTERKDTKLGEYPLFMCGGITAAHGDIMFGELGDGRQSYLDFMCLGLCDTTKWVCEEMDKEWSGETNQDFINHCMEKFDFFYHPQAYKVVYKDNLIVENTKINPHAQDWVRPYYPKVIPSRLGAGRTFTQANGANAGDTQVQISEACTGGASSCFFCSEGNYCLPLTTRVKLSRGLIKAGEVKVGDKALLDGEEHLISAVFNTGKKRILRVKDNYHTHVDVAETHPLLSIENGKLLWKRAGELMPGDWIARDTQEVREGGSIKNPYLLGFVTGDGYLNRSTRKVVVYVPEHEMQEEHVLYLEDALQSEFKYHTTTDTGTKIFAAKSEVESLYEELASYGLEGKSALLKELPEAMFCASWSDKAEFLAGLLDSDGSASAQEGFLKLTFSTASRSLATGLVKLLASQGLKSTLRTREENFHDHKGRMILSKESYDVSIVGRRSLEKVQAGAISARSFKLKRVAYKLPKNTGEYIPTFEGRVKSHYREDKEFNRNVRSEFDTIRKLVNGWTDIKWLNRQHAEYLCHQNGEYVEDMKAAMPFVWVQVEDVEPMGEADTVDFTVDDTHVYSVEGFVSHNSGAWVEDSMDVIRKHVREAKKWSAAVSCKPMSFNINHMSDFTELIYFMNSAFPKVTYLNMRLEELARDPDAFRMMKATGASRISAPIEGLSQRIRNGFMNKNLSQEAIEKLFDFLIGQGVSDIKVGLVWSAFETEEDWKEIRELIARLKAKAASLNKKLPFRLKATALVYYPGTPLEYAARRTSEISFKGERYFNDEMYERNKEAGIHIRINGFRGSTFIEQAIVDLGGSLTQWVQEHLVAQGVVCYNMHPIATEENLPSFKALITSPEKYFTFRDPDCYISPMHRIRLALEGGIAYGVRKLQAGGWLSENAENATEKEPTGKCLFTYAGCKTKCFKKSLKAKPLIKYADVQIKDGHLVGTNPQTVEGCEYCETGKEVVEKHTKRQWSHNFSVDDLQAQVVTRSQFKYRFVLRRLKEYAMLNPHNTAFNAMACLLRQSDVVLDNYWNLTDHSLYNQMDPELACEVSGIQIVDVVFKSEITSEIEEAMVKANKELTTVKFVGVKEIHMDEKLSVNDYNIYKFKATGIPAEAFFTGSRSYSGAVRVLAKVDMQPKVTQTVDKSLVYPYFKVASDGVVGTFALPRRYNPYLFFQEVLAEKKLTQKAIQQAVEFEIVAVGQTNSYAMCKCGKPILQSAIGGQSYGKCPQCLAKALMKKL